MSGANARSNILSRIRAARKVGQSITPAESAAVEERFRDHPVAVQPGMPWETRARFVQECGRMSSSVEEVADVAAIPAALARYLADRQLVSRAICWPDLAVLDWAAAGLAVEGRPARGDDLVGVTGVYLAIAETGTLLFLSSPDTPAATSLLPETHVAVVPADRIVRTMEEAWARMRAEGRDVPRAINFVSGPSRTADIEGQLQIGAHGPFRVHVLIVG
jgi:L-lactate dehydrogenase complex protein LldG